MMRFLLPLILLASAVHADDGGIAGVIGAAISAMSPTSTSPDSQSDSDDDN